MYDSKHKALLASIIGIAVAVGAAMLYITSLPASEPEGRIVSVSIPDGLRKEQTADILAKALGWSVEQERKFVIQDTSRDILHVEGTYPGGTYNLSTASSTYEVASVLLEAAAERYSALGGDLTPDEWYEVLKVASIYERETMSGFDDRLPTILYLRRTGALLQSDATAQYVRDSMQNYANKPCLSDTGDQIAEGMVEYPYQGEGEQPDRMGCVHWRLVYEGAGTDFEWWAPATAADRELQHGYNTYIYPGLPQHPIATPTEAAIKAVLEIR